MWHPRYFGMLPGGQRKMQPIRLTLGALIAGAYACSKSIELPPLGADPTSPVVIEGGLTGRGGGPSAGGADASNSFESSSGVANSGEPGDAAGEVFVVHNEAGPPRTACAGDMATLGSSQLVAGGATPPAFAAAYNAELSSINSPGPFLLALTGVNGPLPSDRIALFGALGRTPQGAVTFAGSRAVVPFSMGEDRAIEIATSEAPFDLRFAPPSEALLPVVSLRLSGILANVCSSLAVTILTLLVPASAGSATFHGSTLASLMGAPTEPWAGAPAGAWLLQLSGVAQQVYAVGILDAGAEP
jgi:hypothetical protein